MRASVIETKKALVLIGSFLSLICFLFCLSACQGNGVKTDLNGSLAYVKMPLTKGKNNSIFIFDGKKETKYTLKEYKYIFSVNTYFSGDFCCECFKENPEERYIVLFKGGKIEERIPIPETVDDKKIKGNREFFAFENEIFFIAQSDLYKIDRQTQKIELIDSDLMQGFFETISAKKDGTIAYIKSKPNTEDWILCTYKDGIITELCDATAVYGWLDNNNILIETPSNELTVFNIINNKAEKADSVFEDIDSNLLYSKDRQYFAFYVWNEDNEDGELDIRIVNAKDQTEISTIRADKEISKNIQGNIVYLEKDYTLKI